MKKIILIILAVLLLLGIGLAIFIYSQDTPLPEGKQGPEAEAMTAKMLEAVNKPAWDTLRYITWNFPGGFNYVWDKSSHEVQVNWGEKSVLLHTKTVDGTATVNGEEVKGEEAQELIDQAWARFCNDSWWLNPTVKANDPGTTRSVVQLEDGREGLMVSYSSGGVTPGDSYVYILGEDGRPTSYLMWVSVLPVGGVEFTFENWKELPGGSFLCTTYASALDLEITDIRSGQEIGDLGLEDNPFE